MADLAIAIEILGKDSFSPVAKGITGTIGGLFEGASKLGLGVFGITQLAQGIGSVASGMISGNAQMETYQSQLETLMGSADAAKDRIAQLAQIGADTPFELPQLVQSEKILMGFGLTTDKTMKLTGKSLDQFRTSLGDMAAGTGTDLGELTNLWGKFGSGATGEAISRLQELGIVTREQLTEVGVQFSKSGELTSPLPEAMAAAVEIADSKFGGGMAKLSQTFEGQMSTLSDSFNQAKTAIMAPIFDVLKNNLTSLNAFLASSTFKDALSGIASLMAGAVKSGVDGLVAGFNALQPVLQIAGDAFTTLQQVFAGDWSADASINPIVNAIGSLASIVRDDVLPVLGTFGDFIGEHFQDIMVGAGAVLLGVVVPAFAAWAVSATAAAAATLVALAPVVLPIVAIGLAAAALHAAWETNFLGIQDITAGLWAFLQPILQGIMTEVGRFGTEMLPLAQAAWTNLSTIVTNIATTLWAAIQTGVTALVSFWQTNHETIEQVVSVAWGLIKGYVQVGWDLVSGIIKTGLQVLSGDWLGAWTTIQETVGNVWTHIQEAIGPAWELISGAIGRALAWILDGISKWATDSLNTVAASMAQLGQEIVDGIGDGIAGAWGNLTNFFGGKLRELFPFAQGVIEAGSPSRLAARLVGLPIAQGIAMGMEQGGGQINDVIQTIVDTAIRHGIDPLIALALAKAESGFNPAAVGDSGASVGLFQLHERGQGAGMSVAQRSDPGTNAEKFLGAHGELFAQLKATGLAGEDLARTFGRLAEGSDPQYAQRYADAYREVVAQFGNTNLGARQTASSLAMLGTVQQQSNVWAETMAAQQAKLAEVLRGQVDPATIQTGTAMANLGAVLGPIERQVAGGSVSMEYLRFKLVDLARATGLATAPWRDYAAGLIDMDEAMMRVVIQSADAGPQFEALRQQLGTTNTITNEGTLQWLQLALAMGKVAPAQATAATATTAATSATASLNSATGQVNQTLDPGQYSAAADAIKGMTDALGGATSAFGEMGGAAGEAQGQIDSLLGSAQSLGDYLDGHTFDFHVNLPSLPDWAIPGSPMPLETALWGLNRALRATNHISAASLGSLPIPTFAGAPASSPVNAGGGGGDTHVQVIVQGNVWSAGALAEELEGHFTRKKTRNGRLAWER